MFILNAKVAASIAPDGNSGNEYIPVFPLFSLLNLSKFLKRSIFFYNKYRYELCPCVNMEIDNCVKKFSAPVLITTCIMSPQTLVAE